MASDALIQLKAGIVTTAVTAVVVAPVAMKGGEAGAGAEIASGRVVVKVAAEIAANVRRDIGKIDTGTERTAVAVMSEIGRRRKNTVIQAIGTIILRMKVINATENIIVVIEMTSQTLVKMTTTVDVNKGNITGNQIAAKMTITIEGRRKTQGHIDGVRVRLK